MAAQQPGEGFGPIAGATTPHPVAPRPPTPALSTIGGEGVFGVDKFGFISVAPELQGM